MIYDYAVIHDGVFYNAGEDVPIVPKTAKEVVLELEEEQSEPLINDEADPVIVPPKRRGRRKK